MNKERTDSLGRALLRGEEQLADGRYRYRFMAADGVRRSVSSRRLLPEDPVVGAAGPSLRELEETVSTVRGDRAETVTVNAMFRRYLNSKGALRPASRRTYERLWSVHAAGSIGKLRLDRVRYSDVKSFYSELRYQRGLSPRTVELIASVLAPTMKLAVRDGLLHRDPADGALSELRRSPGWVFGRRAALTIAQQEAFVEFVSASRAYSRWMPIFTFFLGTGCRIGEVLGLRWCNCDFESGTITIDHALSYWKGEMHLGPTKSASSVRTIPMLREVREALLIERGRQGSAGGCVTPIDGADDFVFLNCRRRVHCPAAVNQILARIVRAYNRTEAGRADPQPPITAHILRHTFCTRFCENETNLRTIQRIMGHSSITVTMDIYADVTEQQKQSVFGNLEGKLRLR